MSISKCFCFYSITRIRAMVQHGLVDRWTRRAFGEAHNRCTVSPSTPQSIVLYDVYGLYLLLFAGMSVAGMILMAEILFKHKINSHRSYNIQ